MKTLLVNVTVMHQVENTVSVALFLQCNTLTHLCLPRTFLVMYNQMRMMHHLEWCIKTYVIA